MIRARLRQDDGTIMLLTLGFAVVAMMLILVVSAATELHLERMRLDRLADELALDAAASMDPAAYYAGDAALPGAVPLSAAGIERAARTRLVDAAARVRLPQAELVEAGTADGATASVTVSAVVHPLFGVDALLPFAKGVTLTATSSARAE